MRKRVICTTIGLTTLAAVGAGGYVYTHPEIIPGEVKETLKEYGLYNNSSNALKIETPKLKFDCKS